MDSPARLAPSARGRHGVGTSVAGDPGRAARLLPIREPRSHRAPKLSDASGSPIWLEAVVRHHPRPGGSRRCEAGRCGPRTASRDDQVHRAPRGPLGRPGVAGPRRHAASPGKRHSPLRPRRLVRRVPRTMRAKDRGVGERRIIRVCMASDQRRRALQSPEPLAAPFRSSLDRVAA